MRNVVGILVAAAVGIHCSAPVESSETSETSEPELAAPAGRSGEQQRAPAPPSDTNVDPTAPQTSLLDLSSVIYGGVPPIVTSTVTDETGATYATGTFVGKVLIGNTVIKSRGDKDVFLIKLTPSGAFGWIRAVGSAALENAPRVTLDEGHRITIIGMTKGEMDCGTGPLNTWDSSQFFVCIFGGYDGSTLNGGVFPTGNL